MWIPTRSSIFPLLLTVFCCCTLNECCCTNLLCTIVCFCFLLFVAAAACWLVDVVLTGHWLVDAVSLLVSGWWIVVGACWTRRSHRYCRGAAISPLCCQSSALSWAPFSMRTLHSSSCLFFRVSSCLVYSASYSQWDGKWVVASELWHKGLAWLHAVCVTSIFLALYFTEKFKQVLVCETCLCSLCFCCA